MKIQTPITRRRRDLGLNLYEFANAINLRFGTPQKPAINPSTLAKIEAKYRPPNEGEMKLFADFFEISEKTLVKEFKQMNKTIEDSLKHHQSVQD